MVSLDNNFDMKIGGVFNTFNTAGGALAWRSVLGR